MTSLIEDTATASSLMASGACQAPRGVGGSFLEEMQGPGQHVHLQHREQTHEGAENKV